MTSRHTASQAAGHHFQIHWGTKSRILDVFCWLELFLIGHKLWSSGGGSIVLWHAGLARLGWEADAAACVYLLVNVSWDPAKLTTLLWILNSGGKIVLQWITSSVQPRHHNNNSTSIKIVRLKCHSYQLKNQNIVEFLGWQEWENKGFVKKVDWIFSLKWWILLKTFTLVNVSDPKSGNKL